MYSLETKDQRIITQERKKQGIIIQGRKKQIYNDNTGKREAKNYFTRKKYKISHCDAAIKSKYKTIFLKCDCLVVCNNNRRQINATLEYYSDVILSLYMCL